MSELTQGSSTELAKGQFWRTDAGLVQVVELGTRLVYYRLARDAKTPALIRMLRRDIFQRHLEENAACLIQAT